MVNEPINSLIKSGQLLGIHCTSVFYDLKKPKYLKQFFFKFFVCVLVSVVGRVQVLVQFFFQLRLIGAQ